MEIGDTHKVNHPECSHMTILGFNDDNEIQIRCHQGCLDKWIAWIDAQLFEEITIKQEG